jgi:hypothetical protein
MLTSPLVNLIVCQQLGRCMQPSVMETRPAVCAAQTLIPFDPSATYIRIGKAPYRIN